MISKEKFEGALRELADVLTCYVSTEDGQWTVKGFIDVFKNVYTISSDTKIVSKILEIHLLPKLSAFAEEYGFAIILAEKQNYYPDVSFVHKENISLKFALDFKTTYRNLQKPWLCNGFTLGSHGAYFRKRSSTKNIQFPYGSYVGHFCLGIIYDRLEKNTKKEANIYSFDDLHSITSVTSNIQFFVAEKWKIAADRRGSGNTANIGSIQRISDILSGNGMFANLGEEWFDDYWMNYGKINFKTESGETKVIKSLEEFVRFRGGDTSLIIPRNNKK